MVLGGRGLRHTSAGRRPRYSQRIAYAVNAPEGFQPIYQADVPADQDHWHYQADREVKLERPVKTVYLRYVGDPGVNNLRIYAHCVDDRPHASSAVVITHTWIENGVRKVQTVTRTQPGPYEITAAADPVDESIEIAVPSAGAKKP